MRGFPPDATPGRLSGNAGHADTDLYASSDYGPPAPLEMFTRIGVLLVITLGFGLAAQLLVGMSH